MMKSELLLQYAPYHFHAEFYEGWDAYERGDYRNPYTDVKAQAWDRGAEAAMRWNRQQHTI